MRVGVLAGFGEIAERDERLGGVDAPRRDPGWTDVELVPACGGVEQIGVGVRRAVLGEPQPRAALQQQR